MNKLILPALVCAIAPLAFAAETKEQLAEKFLEVSGARKTMDETMEKTGEMMLSQMGDLSRFPEAMRPKMQAAVKRISALLKTEMGWAKMKPEMIRLYAETYTVAEMKAAIAFYESPEGKSIAAKMGALTAKTAEWGMKQGAALGPKIQQIMQEELSKPDAPAPASPAAPAPSTATAK